MIIEMSKNLWVTEDSGLAVRQCKPLRVAVRPQHLLQAISGRDLARPVIHPNTLTKLWPFCVLMIGS